MPKRKKPKVHSKDYTWHKRYANKRYRRVVRELARQGKFDIIPIDSNEVYDVHYNDI